MRVIPFLLFESFHRDTSLRQCQQCVVDLARIGAGIEQSIEFLVIVLPSCVLDPHTSYNSLLYSPVALGLAVHDGQQKGTEEIPSGEICQGI